MSEQHESKRTPKAALIQDNDQRTAVLVDVQNMFYSAKLLRQSKVDYGKLLDGLVGNRQIVRAIAYIIQKPDVDQRGFHEALFRFGYELKIKELKIRSNESGGTSAKGSWDVGMTVDAMTMANKIDTFILVTGDGDYIPLVNALKVHGCRVEVCSFERSTAGELIKAADQYIPMQEEWIFKEKKFEQASAEPVVHEGLPNDEELDKETADLEASGNTYNPDDNKGMGVLG